MNDDFDQYLHARRRELGVTPGLFWREYALTLAGVIGCAAIATGVVLAAPYIADFIGAK
jgi:hypothetical protein